MNRPMTRYCSILLTLAGVQFLILCTHTYVYAECCICTSNITIFRIFIKYDIIDINVRFTVPYQFN